MSYKTGSRTLRDSEHYSVPRYCSVPPLGRGKEVDWLYMQVHEARSTVVLLRLECSCIFSLCSTFWVTYTSEKNYCEEASNDVRPSYNYIDDFLSSSSSIKLHDSFTIVFTENSSISYWAVHQPIALSQLWGLMRYFKPVYGSFAMPFSSLACGDNSIKQFSIQPHPTYLFAC